jgi:hypothetical protein
VESDGPRVGKVRSAEEFHHKSVTLALYIIHPEYMSDNLELLPELPSSDDMRKLIALLKEVMLYRHIAS